MTDKKLRLDVQGLRAIAVLAVMVYHLNETLLPSGFVGVDVFFVISGFIITSLILHKREGFDWVGFYWGRIKRIVPAYFSMLAVVAFFSSILLLPADFKYFWESLKAASIFTSNSYFLGFGSYFAPSAHELPLLHTWSLAVEMQFYLLLPFLVCFIPIRLVKPVVILLFLGFLAWSEYWLSSGGGHAVYFSLLARIPEFLVGVLVALFQPRFSIRLGCNSLVGSCGALLLAISFIFIDVQRFPGVLSLLPCLGAALIIAARCGPISAMLAAKPMVWIGGISYSLYLWHWPILACIRYYTGKYDLDPVWSATFFVGTVVIAWASYLLIELPLRNIKTESAAWKKMLAFSVFVTAVILCSKQLNIAVVDPLPIEMTRYAPSDKICHGKVIAECTRGESNLKPSVLVIGDSHAAQLNYFFDEVGQEKDMAFRVITASSCVPITGFDVDRLPKWARDACRSQIKEVRALIPKMDLIVVAGMWQYQVQSKEFLQALTRFIEMADAKNKKVVVLAQIPMFDSNLLRIHRFSELGLPVRIRQNQEWRAANLEISSIVKRSPSSRFLDLSESEFFVNAPFYNGDLIYLDNHHLNEVGARRYGRFAADLIKSSLAVDN